MARSCATPDRGQRGLTLVEVLVAVLVLALGIGMAFSAFAMPQKQTLTAQREGQAAAIAEADIEALAQRPYADIGLTSLPARVSDPTPANPSDPRAWVSASNAQNFLVMADYHDSSKGPLAEVGSAGEPMVTTANGVPYSAATPASGPSGTVYRFVTYRSEPCDPNLGPTLNGLLSPVLNVLSGLAAKLTTWANGGLNLFCGAQNNQKRITVAVVLDRAANGAGPFKPVYVSTLVPNPAAGLTGGYTCTVSLLGICL